jgi:selenocysteine-specific elongation factor
VARVAALEQRDPVEALRRQLALPPGSIERVPFVRARNLPPAQQTEIMLAAPAVAVASLLMSPSTLDALRTDALMKLAAHHAAAPDQPGLQPERLRLAMPNRPQPDAFRAIIEALFRDRRLEQDGPWLRLPTHRATLSAQDERVWQKVSELITADRFRPPRTRDLAHSLSVPEAAMRATLKRVQRMGRIIEVAPDQFFLSETIAEMLGIAANIARADVAGMLTAAEFRDRLDNGRKVAIQVLEFFDRAGVTVRVGDARRVRSDRLGMFGQAPTDAV